jgi:hypothetical protein
MTVADSKPPIEPVAPGRMEFLFFYPCPECGKDLPHTNPTVPCMLSCPVCGERFPIIPVDERSLQYIRIMLAGGRAAVDPDFL